VAPILLIIRYTKNGVFSGQGVCTHPTHLVCLRHCLSLSQRQSTVTHRNRCSPIYRLRYHWLIIGTFEYKYMNWSDLLFFCPEVQYNGNVTYHLALRWVPIYSYTHLDLETFSSCGPSVGMFLNSAVSSSWSSSINHLQDNIRGKTNCANTGERIKHAHNMETRCHYSWTMRPRYWRKRIK